MGRLFTHSSCITKKKTSKNLNPIWIASDHAGVSLKKFLKNNLPDREWNDLGPFKETSVDYPDFAFLLSMKIKNAPKVKCKPCGILICGSGIGMSIAANKIHGIRAALAENLLAARLSREHNNANVLCLGSRFLAPEYALEIVKEWLATPFSKDAKHQKRIDKIMLQEKK